MISPWLEAVRAVPHALTCLARLSIADKPAPAHYACTCDRDVRISVGFFEACNASSEHEHGDWETACLAAFTKASAPEET